MLNVEWMYINGLGLGTDDRHFVLSFVVLVSSTVLFLVSISVSVIELSGLITFVSIFLFVQFLSF